MKVKCNKCGYMGDISEFSTGRDFFQKIFIKGCPKCDNHQNPADASLRMMPGMKHPFTFVREESIDHPLTKTLHNATEAS